MKKGIHITLMLLVLAIMASCDGNHQNQTEKTPSPQKEAISVAEEVVTPDFSNAEDTVCYKDHVFFSQPIPEAVKARMQGKSMPEKARISYDELRYLTLFYYDFEGKTQQGEMVCNKAIAHDLLCIFRTLFAEAYPINSIRLVDDFDASDEASMQANNSSSFPIFAT